jgi:hypothetical protein
MITLGLNGGDNFHWYVPARAILSWANEIDVVWLFDITLDRPTENDIDQIPLENINVRSLTPTPALPKENEVSWGYYHGGYYYQGRFRYPLLYGVPPISKKARFDIYPYGPFVYPNPYGPFA